MNHLESKWMVHFFFCALDEWVGPKGPFTNTWNGGLGPFQVDLKTISGPPLFAMKITGQPHKKACKLNFYWKICGNFFQGPPLTRVKNFKGPFLHQAPLTSISEWSLKVFFFRLFLDCVLCSSRQSTTSRWTLFILNVTDCSMHELDSFSHMRTHKP